VAILLAGAAGGAALLARIVRAGGLHGGDYAWLILAAAVDLACARLCAGLAFPWL
jgi:hypothetical protein